MSDYTLEVIDEGILDPETRSIPDKLDIWSVIETVALRARGRRNARIRVLDADGKIVVQTGAASVILARARTSSSRQHVGEAA